MKNILIAATAAGLALVASTAAASGSYYLQGNVGYAFNAKHKTTLTAARDAAAAAQTGSLKSTGKKGMLGSVALGYKVNDNFRTELEIYADNGSKSKGKAFTATNAFTGAKAEVKSFGGFLNGYYDVKNSTKFTPFVGAGVGYLSNKGTLSAIRGANVSTFKAKKAKFAYKLVAGVSYEFAKNMSVLAQYQYLDKGKFHKGGVKFASTSHAAMLGVRFGF